MEITKTLKLILHNPANKLTLTSRDLIESALISLEITSDRITEDSARLRGANEFLVAAGIQAILLYKNANEVINSESWLTICKIMEEYKDLHQTAEEALKICSGCGTLSTKIIPPPALTCCPDSNYILIREYWKNSTYKS